MQDRETQTEKERQFWIGYYRIMAKPPVIIPYKKPYSQVPYSDEHLFMMAI